MEEEALIILNYKDDNAILIFAIFMFILRMLIVVNQNIH